jgi:hypothetical protein
MLDNQEDQQRFNEAVGRAHLYHQQHIIDEYKIDYAEFRNRIDPFDIPGIMTEFATEIDLPENAEVKVILERALDLINNPPA